MTSKRDARVWDALNAVDGRIRRELYASSSVPFDDADRQLITRTVNAALRIIEEVGAAYGPGYGIAEKSTKTPVKAPRKRRNVSGNLIL